MPCVLGPSYQAAASAQAGAFTKAVAVDAAVQVALMLWQQKTRKKIIKDQNDLAKRQVVLAEQVHAHEEEFWPAEKEFLHQFFTEPEHKDHKDEISAQWGKLAKDALKTGRGDWMKQMKHRCLSPTRCEDARWKREEMRSRADIMTFADRHAEARKEALNDNRYSKQYAAPSLSKGLMNEIVGYTDAMATARNAANSILADTVDTVSSAIGYISSQASSHYTGGPRWGLGQSQYFRAGVK